jgi:hypothetical protein
MPSVLQRHTSCTREWYGVPATEAADAQPCPCAGVWQLMCNHALVVAYGPATWFPSLLIAAGWQLLLLLLHRLSVFA